MDGFITNTTPYHDSQQQANRPAWIVVAVAPNYYLVTARRRMVATAGLSPRGRWRLRDRGLLVRRLRYSLYRKTKDFSRCPGLDVTLRDTLSGATHQYTGMDYREIEN